MFYEQIWKNYPLVVGRDEYKVCIVNLYNSLITWSCDIQIGLS